MRKDTRVVITAAILVLLMTMAAMAGDPFVGIWTLNVEKSKGPAPPPRSNTLKIEAQKDGYKIVRDLVSADGKVTHTENDFETDGQEHPSRNPNADSYVATRVNGSTYGFVFKKFGKQVLSWRFVVSKDGKTMACTIKQKNANGEDVPIEAFFDRHQ
jgi:hypothetical protein